MRPRQPKRTGVSPSGPLEIEEAGLDAVEPLAQGVDIGRSRSSGLRRQPGDAVHDPLLRLVDAVLQHVDALERRIEAPVEGIRAVRGLLRGLLQVLQATARGREALHGPVELAPQPGQLGGVGRAAPREGEGTAEQDRRRQADRVRQRMAPEEAAQELLLLRRERQRLPPRRLHRCSHRQFAGVPESGGP
jgi:hypothetical protein